MIIGDNELHLYLVDADTVEKTALRLLSAECLTSQEHHQQDRFKFAYLKNQYAIARILQRTVLSRYVPLVSPNAWIFNRNRYGKPFVSNPLSRSIYFNLSHTTGITNKDGMIVMVVANQPMVGIDVECRKRTMSELGLFENHFMKDEWRSVMVCQPEFRLDTFYLLWTLKESFIKAIGRGLSQNLQDFGFVIDEFKSIRAYMANNLPERQLSWQFRGFEYGDYIISLSAGLSMLNSIRIFRNKGLNEWLDVDVSADYSGLWHREHE